MLVGFSLLFFPPLSETFLELLGPWHFKRASAPLFIPRCQRAQLFRTFLKILFTIGSKLKIIQATSIKCLSSRNKWIFLAICISRQMIFFSPRPNRYYLLAAIPVAVTLMFPPSNIASQIIPYSHIILQVFAFPPLLRLILLHSEVFSNLW